MQPFALAFVKDSNGFLYMIRFREPGRLPYVVERGLVGEEAAGHVQKCTVKRRWLVAGHEQNSTVKRCGLEEG